MNNDKRYDLSEEGACAVIFGGTGFIGVHFAKKLVNDSKLRKIYLFDLLSVEEHGYDYRTNLLRGDDRIHVINGDVRLDLTWFRPIEKVELVVNLAAVHREPGHKPEEYFETNLIGAKNVCDWAEKSGCETLVFSSSIAPYGPSQGVKDEEALPCPASPYGASKLVAEKIHELWLAQGGSDRRLLILRPGVVFGPSEGGNVSRLVKAVIGNYFVYTGNRDTRKAGIYVKELCDAVSWILLHHLNSSNQFILFNACMKETPSVRDYVEAIVDICKIKRIVLNFPFFLVYLFSWGLEIICALMQVKNKISPVRIKKLVLENYIHPKKLMKLGYDFKWDLRTALKDWKTECPEEW